MIEISTCFRHLDGEIGIGINTNIPKEEIEKIKYIVFERHNQKYKILEVWGDKSPFDLILEPNLVKTVKLNEKVMPILRIIK